jgi:hypothetical protein
MVVSSSYYHHHRHYLSLLVPLAGRIDLARDDLLFYVDEIVPRYVVQSHHKSTSNEPIIYQSVMEKSQRV